MKRCPNCNTEYADTAKFCTTCGTPLPTPQFCTKCGKPLNPDFKFCTNCGTPRSAAASPKVNDTRPQIPIPASHPDEKPSIPDLNQTPNGEAEVASSTDDVTEATSSANETTGATNTDIPTPESALENSEYEGGNLDDYSVYLEPPKKNITPWILGIMLVIVIIGLIGWRFREDILDAGQKLGWIPQNSEVVQEKNTEAVDESMVTEEANVESVTPVISGNDLIYLSGKIDEKYAVHMVLDLRQRLGVYYYDKYGPDNVVPIIISQLRKTSENQWTVGLVKSTDNRDSEEKWAGVLTNTLFTGAGEYLGKDLPFELKVESIESDSSDPLIEKSIYDRELRANEWSGCRFAGYASSGGNEYPFYITARRNGNGEFDNGMYYNEDYDTSFPIDIEIKGSNLYITGKSGNTGLSIKAYRDGSEYRGTMSSGGSSLPVTLSLIL